jgi:multicomponent Na+:H+ antiporter subunit G
VALRLRSASDLATLLLIGLFQLATAPVAAHMISRAAYRSNRFRPELLTDDDLATETAGRGASPGAVGP